MLDAHRHALGRQTSGRQDRTSIFWHSVKHAMQIVPSVTGKVYNHSKRIKEKRAVLDGVAAELRRITGQPAVKAVD
jgi:hypothetical protein